MNSRRSITPQAIVLGRPMETTTIACDLTRISTISDRDIQSVLVGVSGAIHTRMAEDRGES